MPTQQSFCNSTAVPGRQGRGSTGRKILGRAASSGVVALLVLGVMGCSSDDPATSAPSSTRAPLPTPTEVIAISPATVAPGDEVDLRFVGDLAESRGGFFVLVDDSDQSVAGLWQDFDGEDRGYTLDLDDYGVLDFGVTGPGPNIVPIPSEITPGAYRICTENSRPVGCGEITVEASLDE